MTRTILSFRKFSTGDTARRIEAILGSAFGSQNVIAGTESLLALSEDTEYAVIDTVMQADVLLVIIDHNWLAGGWTSDATDTDVMAINTALYDPTTRVIPLLLDGAKMPSTADLPVTLHELTRRKPLKISNTTLDSDIWRLIHQLNPSAFVSPNGSPFAGQQFPVPQYRKASTVDPNLVFIVEFLGAFVGFLGFGHIISGNVSRGIFTLIGWWLYVTVGLFLAIATVVGMCFWVPGLVAIPFWSAYEARQYVLTH